MHNESKSKPRLKHPDRVTLSEESLCRLGSWIAEAENYLKGHRLSKSELVNFIILSRPSLLSEAELTQLETTYFDEIRFTTWALRQLKAARATGKATSLLEIMSQSPARTQKRGADER